MPSTKGVDMKSSSLKQDEGTTEAIRMAAATVEAGLKRMSLPRNVYSVICTAGSLTSSEAYDIMKALEAEGYFIVHRSQNEKSLRKSLNK